MLLLFATIGIFCYDILIVIGYRWREPIRSVKDVLLPIGIGGVFGIGIAMLLNLIFAN